MKRTPEHLRRVRELFDRLIDTAPAARAALLDTDAAGDADLRADVEQMLSSTPETDAFDLSPVSPHEYFTASQNTALEGTRLGPWELVRLIGVGGMGAVYEAVRADDQFRQRVAIKLVQRDIESDIARARFIRERQILASLQHANIAALHDGGVAADGRPYLVMEYVDGQPITQWCAARSVDVAGRAQLFRQVCRAVHHAHQNLVIHRDLKPGNILVTPDGTVKLLDFGIAKLLDTDGGNADDALPLTRGGVNAYTPEYASPEQIRGAALKTTSDVYSLGVVLYELLAGRRPHAVASRAAADVERAILNEPIRPPSALVTEEAAATRGERSAARLRRRLEGELDHIVMMALRPEPERRYASVEALGDDLQRYLTGEPIRAHRDWAGYRLRKFAQRNAAAVTASVLVLVALVGGVVTTTIQAHRAQSEQLKEQQVNGFLRSLLSSVKPVTGGRDVAASELFDAAARRLDVDRTTPPAIRAELQLVIGQSYLALGHFREAAHQDSAALALYQQTDGAASTAAVAALSAVGQVYLQQGQLDRADTLLHRAYALYASHRSHPDSAYAGLTENLGSLAHYRGDNATSERYHREALDLRRQLFGPASDMTAYGLNDLAVALGDEGKFGDAEPLHRQSVAILRQNHEEPTLELAGVLNALATALDLSGKAAGADSSYKETLAIRRKLLGADHPDYAMTLMNYSGFLFDQHRYDEAAADSREILALRDKTLPESHPSIASALQTLGRSLDHQGDSAGARAALEESLALRRKYVGADGWLAGNSEGVLGDHFTANKDYVHAEPLVIDAVRLVGNALGPGHPRTLVNIRRLIALYAAWGKTAKAAEWQAKLPAPK